MIRTLSQTRRIPAAAAVAGAVLALLAMQAPMVDARERGAAAQRPARAMPQRPAPVRPPVTRTTETQRTDNGFVRNTTLTRPDGATATRNTTVTVDKEAGTRTRASEMTTFDGRNANSTTVTTRTENGFTRETSGTRPNGETFERSVTRECDRAAGKCTTTVDNGRGNGG
ncbi:MAG: hypothetical protein R3E65_10815 [Steroidobacteraceae bacterium]